MRKDNKKRLILLELNEVNFDLVKKYVEVEVSRFPGLARLFKLKMVNSLAEENYDELEPWIQWPSVHTAKTYSEHQIFRLGDVVNSECPQIFEMIEQAGFKVGAISAMNAENRLIKPSYFIPDPWTKTHSDSSWWSRSLTESISQAVNDNSQSKITIKSAAQILMALVYFARFKNYSRYIRLFIHSKQKPWLKSLVLDLLLNDIHWKLFKKKKPDFSILFLNAGAHIQHHYFFNSKHLKNTLTYKNPSWYIRDEDDPIYDLLKLYDFILQDFLLQNDAEVIIATGLSQKPYDSLKYYYRISNHRVFLDNLGIKFVSVYPRMTRDFLIEFKNELEALNAQIILSNIIVNNDGLKLFGKIDNRGQSLFVTLTYPNEITEYTKCSANGKVLFLKKLVNFVAIKNGMHQSVGYSFFTKGVQCHAPANFFHVSKLGDVILNFFKVSQ